MSSPKGVTFVLSVALVPPALVVLRSFLNPRYLIDTPKTLLGLYLIIYLLAVRGITIPYFTSPLRALPQPTGSGGFLSGDGGAEFVQPRGKRYREWIDSIPHSGLIFFRGFLHAVQTVVLASPEALYDVLVTNSYDFEKPSPGRKLLSRTIGEGLINTEGPEHKFQRKGVTPAFSGKHIRELVPIFWAKSQEVFDAIADVHLTTQVPVDGSTKSTRTGVVEINQWASRVTLDIIGLACVGRDFGSIRNSDDEFVQQYEKILRTDNSIPIFYAIATIITPLWLGRLTPFWTRFRLASDGRYRLRGLCKRLIEVKRRDMQTESAKHIDILSVLIRNGQFNDEQLVSQLLTFLAAGHETTSGALTWTSWLLAIHPEIQTKLRDEIRAFTETGAPVDATALDNLPYLHAVTSEQLRLWPSVPNTGRLTVRDSTILGQRIPKGTMIVISPWAINRSTKLWGPDAEKYVPERWLGNEKEPQYGGAKGAFSLITFLHGPRGCIGQTFSRLELKCLVMAMVQKFEISMADPDEVIVPGGFITIKPKDGMRLRLKEIVA